MSTAARIPPERSHVDYGLASDLRVVIGRLVRMLRTDHKLGMTHASVLGRLDREGSLCTGDLARAERVRPQSMSQTVAELETAGLVVRGPDELDGRRSRVVLTPAGLDALHEDRAAREGRLAVALEEKLTPQERAVVVEAVALLERITEQ